MMKLALMLSVGLVGVSCSSSHTKASVGSDGSTVVRTDDDDDDDDGDEQTIAASALPASIVDAVKAAVPGITITEAEVEGDGYCVHGTVDGEFVEVEVDENGKVGDIEYGDDEDDDDGDDD
jgi:hypothetical protein